MPSRSFRHIGQIIATILVCALALGGSAMAQSVSTGGDGSDSDNMRLMPGVYPAAPVAPLSADIGGLREPYKPYFNIDWSMALRGTYAKTQSDEKFDVILAPSVNLDHTSSRSQLNISASAEIDQPVKDKINVSGLRLGLGMGYSLDSQTTLNGNAALVIARQRPGSSGLASNIVTAPQTIVGSIDAEVTRQFGRLNVGVNGGIERSVYGDSVLTGGITTDNGEQDQWHFDGGLRLGFQASPVFELFTQANVGRDVFDQPSSVLLVKPNATDMAIKAGIAAKWSSVLAAQGSVGVNFRRFDANSLGQVTSRLYDAKLVFTPDPTWRFTAGLTTNITPPGPNGAGTTKLAYDANAEAQYIVNSWLLLRAAADWNSARYEGSAEVENGYGYGFGADYNVSSHTALSADYDFEHAESTSKGPQDSHRVTVGVTISR